MRGKGNTHFMAGRVIWREADPKEEEKATPILWQAGRLNKTKLLTGMKCVKSCFSVSVILLHGFVA